LIVTNQPERDAMTNKGRFLTLGMLCASVLFSPASHAADAAPLPDSLLKADTASSGATDVATSGFEKAEKPTPDAKDATELQLSAGGLASAGNSRSIAGTGAGKFRLRREANQVGAAVAANFARAAAKKDTALQTTVENFQGKLRYDRFLAGSFAVFGAASARHDRFQGLDLRLNFDPGIEYYLVDQSNEQLWTEVGYD